MLTQREIQVLQLAANGLRVSEIASEIGVSIRTVEAHLASARVKLDAVNTTHAAVKGVRAGIIWAVACVLSINALSLNYDTEMARIARPVVKITRAVRRNET